MTTSKKYYSIYSNKNPEDVCSLIRENGSVAWVERDSCGFDFVVSDHPFDQVARWARGQFWLGPAPKGTEHGIDMNGRNASYYLKRQVRRVNGAALKCMLAIVELNDHAGAIYGLKPKDRAAWLCKAKKLCGKAGSLLQDSGSLVNQFHRYIEMIDAAGVAHKYTAFLDQYLTGTVAGLRELDTTLREQIEGMESPIE